jgi:hypothetical protein
LARNCPKGNGGKGGVNSFEGEEYEGEEGAGEELEAEWLGYVGEPEKESGWLGCLHALGDDCVGCLGEVENQRHKQDEWKTPKQTVKSVLPRKCENKSHKEKPNTKNSFEELKEKEILNIEGTWKPISITIDSGAGNNVAPKDSFPWIDLVANEDSRNGRFYTTANGKRVYVLGEKVVTVRSKEGVTKKMKFQIRDVTRILASVGKITMSDNKVNMHKTGGAIMDSNGDNIEIEIENGVYVVNVLVKTSGFTRPGQ